MKITKFKIGPRTAMDYVEIGPFSSYNEALTVCRESGWEDRCIKSFEVELNDLQKLAYFLIKNHGIQVLVDKKEPRGYFSFSDGKRIGYIQHNTYGCGYDYSKSNKPSKDHGTGFRTVSESDATYENCIKTLDAYDGQLSTDKSCACCGSITHRGEDLRYSDVDQFIKYQQKFWKDYGAITIDEIPLYII